MFWTLSEGAAAAALVIALAQLAASPWRDVGVLTLCAAACSVAAARGFPSAIEAWALLVALGVAAVAWARGARHGVGRPGLAGLGIAALAVGVLTPYALPDLLPPGPRERIMQGTLVLIGLCGSIGLALALERPGPRRPQLRLFRRVDIRTPDRDNRTGSSPGDPGDPGDLDPAGPGHDASAASAAH